MSQKALILCVDDEPVNLLIMEELLQDNYELLTARSGEDCLQQVSMQIPDLILLDVNLPDMDGLETCVRLKSDPETAEIPIIFVSALASQEELMAGYEAGGDDYITKPFSEEILRKKIEIVLASQKRRQELKNISDQAVEALMNNLSTTEELGMVVKFLYQCQSVDTLDELARKVFDTLREFELDSSLLILDQPENRIWFSDDIDRPMEIQILESLRGQDRVVRFGTRLAINTDHATILVRNLPSEVNKIDRVREHLSILIEGLDTRIKAMQSQMLLDQRREVLARVLEATRDNLAKLDEMHRQQKARSAEILSIMSKELEKSLDKLDLSARQETALKKILASSAEQTDSVYDEGLKIDEQFQGIIDELSSALNE
ncbi:MAG: response regulator [Gammaproteobacteria bacterium]|nr:MAG: response regulator [Gammaproteobacteria bacterium]